MDLLFYSYLIGLLSEAKTKGGNEFGKLSSAWSPWIESLDSNIAIG